MTSKPVLLVHGAWHGAWCWSALQAELDRLGVVSWAIDLPGHGLSTEPLGDLTTDATAVRGAVAAIAAQHGDVVLVGHSYGGGVITEAAAQLAHGDGGVAHLVYVTAFATAQGESVGGLAGALPPREVALVAGMQFADDGTINFGPEEVAAEAFYGHCSAPAASAAFARLGAHHASSFAQPCSGDPRATIGSTYVVCSDDRAIHPDHQRLMAERCGRTVELAADHSPFLSMPTETAAVLADLAHL